MPIVITNNSNAQAPSYSPKFFSNILTGNGKGMGLLNVSLDFKMIDIKLVLMHHFIKS